MVKNTVTDVQIGNFGIGNLLIKQGSTMQAFHLTDKQLMLLQLHIESHLKRKTEIGKYDKIKQSDIDAMINGEDIGAEAALNFELYATVLIIDGKDVADCMVVDDESSMGCAEAYIADHT
jgi:hypothetical protein